MDIFFHIIIDFTREKEENMNKKLPRVMAVPIRKKISHNKEVFYGSSVFSQDTSFEDTTSVIPMDREVILSRINAIFHSTHHSFRIPVEIRTKDQTFHTKIIGKFNDRLLTMDDQEILIDDIISFREEK